MRSIQLCVCFLLNVEACKSYTMKILFTYKAKNQRRAVCAELIHMIQYSAEMALPKLSYGVWFMFLCQSVAKL